MRDALADRYTLVAVVAMARNRVIGRDGAMPWSLPSDLKRYRRATVGKPMIMGRKTLESIGRVLDGRDTIVLTRSPAVPFEGALVAHTPEEALAAAASCADRRGTNEIVIAGGAEIYRLFLPRIDRLEITWVDATPNGDTVFPAFDDADWTTLAEETPERGAGDSASVRFAVLQRRRPARDR